MENFIKSTELWLVLLVQRLYQPNPLSYKSNELTWYNNTVESALKAPINISLQSLSWLG